MPLIVLCGRPSSGKTTRAMELKTYLEGISKMPVVVLNEESLGLDRNSSYADNVKEKEFRGFFRSHVEKNLNQQTIVIVDTLNYIKGVRYEYYCLARTAKTTYAVVYCETPIDAASAWNSSRDPKQAYAQPLFEDLWKRMEEPNSRNRWDSPLFLTIYQQATPLKDIAQAILYDDKKSKDPVSTKPDILKSGNFVHDLDKVLQRILDTIIEKQNEMVLLNGGLDRLFLNIKFEGIDRELKLKRAVPVGQLKQFKADFINMNKHAPLQSLEKAGVAFVDYIQKYENDY